MRVGVKRIFCQKMDMGVMDSTDVGVDLCKFPDRKVLHMENNSEEESNLLLQVYI